MRPANVAETHTTIRFSSQLVEGGNLALPTDFLAQLSEADSKLVEGTIGGFPVRVPISGDSIVISEAQRKAIGANEGDSLPVEITRIGDEPEVRVPADLLDALAAAAPAKELWPEITPMARREWVRWIASAKQEETRARRIEVGMDKLSKGMRRPCCFPGLNWVTKDHVSPEETWITLPGSKSRDTAK